MPEFKHSVFGSTGMSSEPKNTKVENPVGNISDLQSLIELGCVRDTIILNDKIFTMRTLNAKEKLELAKFLGDEPTAERLFNFNIKLLAMATELVNGMPFENFHTNIQMDPFMRKQELLAEMQSPVLAKLLDFYNKITERCDTQFNLEEIKK